MPSPLGHALGGLAAGWLVAGPPHGESQALPGAVPSAPRLQRARQAALFAAVGMAADLDLLVGRHSQFTHSIGMALIVGLVAWLLAVGRRHSAPGTGVGTRPSARRALHCSAAVLAAYASHILLDWLGQDATPPLGITALWPFSSAYFLSHADLFWGISREPWRPGAVGHDVVAIARELVILGPVALAAWLLRGRHVLPPAPGNSRQELPPGLRARHEGESDELT